MTTATPPILIDVYADIACPWCYIGERRLARALAERPELRAERRWRPFQLQPGLPAAGLPWAAFVEQKFGGADRAAQAFAQGRRGGGNRRGCASTSRGCRKRRTRARPIA
jgi:predicted DsbA family dithiol-disulfide isomerase